MNTLKATARVDAAEFIREYRHVEVDPGTTLDDLLRPGFWVHHAERIGVNDILDVVASDGSLDVQLRVVKKDKGLLFMRPRFGYQRDDIVPAAAAEEAAEGPAVPDNYVVDHTPKTRWRARMRNPAIEVSRGHMTRSEAVQAAITHAAQAAGV